VQEHVAKIPRPTLPDGGRNFRTERVNPPRALTPPPARSPAPNRPRRPEPCYHVTRLGASVQLHHRIITEVHASGGGWLRVLLCLITVSLTTSRVAPLATSSAAHELPKQPAVLLVGVQGRLRALLCAHRLLGGARGRAGGCLDLPQVAEGVLCLLTKLT
jgi:hypothetical protein